MPAKRLEITLSEEQWGRLDGARGFEPRASFVKRALEERLDERELLQRIGDETDAIRIEGRPATLTATLSRAPTKPKPQPRPAKSSLACPDHPNSGSQESRGSLWCGEPGCPRRLS